MGTKSERLAQVHEEAIREFNDVQGVMSEERLQCLQDRRFYSIPGAQWEGDLQAQFENKPRFEVNKIHLAVIRIINEYRNNRIDVLFVPKDGDPSNGMADLCNGLLRADEQDSSAEEAYDNAFEEAIGGGFGAVRIRACYEDEGDPENDKQRVRIEPLYDADTSVFYDLNSKRQDKADATKAWVLTSMSAQAYKDEYDDDPASWPKTTQQYSFDWATPDVVIVCEYYVVEEKRERVYTYTDIMGTEERYTEDELTEDLRAELKAIGTTETRSKKVKTTRVHKYIMSGGAVLEDCGLIAGKNIPVVPVYGKRWYVDNIERCMGHVRLAKDAQRLKNMQLSKLGEISALSSIQKPIFTPEQVAGHQVMWSEDNIKNFPYLLVNPVTDISGNAQVTGPVGYTKSSDIPPAMAALLQITETDMQDLLGNQQAAEEVKPNVSGMAIELVQNRLDMQTFIYMSNFAKFRKRCGEVWLSMAQDVYIEEGRKLKSLDLQGRPAQVTLLEPKMNTKTGSADVGNDLSTAKLDVSVEVGPSSASKRAAAVKALAGMAQITSDPETKQVLGAMALMNMEGEGISDARDYFRNKLIKMKVIEPTQEEVQKMKDNPDQPDAQSTYLRAAAEQASAEAVKARADSLLVLAKMEESKAHAVQILASVDAQHQTQALEVLDRFAAIPGAPQQPKRGT